MLNSDRFMCLLYKENIACKQSKVGIEFCKTGVLAKAFLHRLRLMQKVSDRAMQELYTTQVFWIIGVAVIDIFQASHSQQVLAAAVHHCPQLLDLRWGVPNKSYSIAVFVASVAGSLLTMTWKAAIGRGRLAIMHDLNILAMCSRYLTSAQIRS